jgi:hypothetical protein
MKHGTKYIVTIVMVIILSACGSSAPPTMSSADIQGTAVAAAWTIVAMTQAAIPTNTPIPPTETPSPTPQPTFTPLTLPTSAFPTLGTGATAAGAATVDLCNLPVAAGAPGHKAKVQFQNKSNGNVNLAFGLMRPTDFGECGTYHFTFSKTESPVVEVLAGCYWAYAWVTGKKPSTAVNIYEFCITPSGGQKWFIAIKPDVIVWGG